MDVSVKACASAFNIFCNKASDVDCCDGQRVSTLIEHVPKPVKRGRGVGGEREHMVSTSLFSNIERMLKQMLKQSARAFSEETLKGFLESSLHAQAERTERGLKKMTCKGRVSFQIAKGNLKDLKRTLCEGQNIPHLFSK